MLKKIIVYCTVGTIGLIVFVVLSHSKTKNAADTVLGSFTASHDEALVPQASSQGDALSNDAIFTATNEERVQAGLAPLILNAKLSASAKPKVDDMIARQYFEHVSPAGEDVSDLGTKVGYSFVVMGENLALGDFKDADDLLTAWMNSTGHRANILNSNYRELGVYTAQGMYKGKEVWFAVQHFGTARSVCPVIDSSLKGQIAAMNATLKTEEAQIAAMRTELEAPNHAQGDAYNAMVNDFNAKVKSYNDLLAESQKSIALFNSQVVDFNTCLKRYQKTS